MTMTSTRIELTPQQRTVLQLSWDGLAVKEIAKVMGLSDKTVKNYRANMYDKFGVRNIEGLLRRGVECGYLSAHRTMEEWP